MMTSVPMMYIRDTPYACTIDATCIENVASQQLLFEQRITPRNTTTLKMFTTLSVAVVTPASLTNAGPSAVVDVRRHCPALDVLIDEVLNRRPSILLGHDRQGGRMSQRNCCSRAHSIPSLFYRRVEILNYLADDLTTKVYLNDRYNWCEGSI